MKKLFFTLIIFYFLIENIQAQSDSLPKELVEAIKKYLEENAP